MSAEKRLVMQRLMEIWKKLVNPETVSYLVFGVLTTVINIAAFGLLYDMLAWPLVAANVLAWLLSVIFAFLTNKLFVFRSKSFAPRIFLRELVSFFAARLLSLGVDTAGMWILVDLLLVNSWIAKIAMNVVVIIMNYVLSKLIIFKKEK